MTPSEVTQAEVDAAPEDRKAAWPFRSEPYRDEDWGAWMCGRYDRAPIIQAFARHRIAALTNRDEAIEEAASLVELETWPDIKDDADAIVKCGERWKAVANILGCELCGFDDGRSATFFTPDGNSINVGPKFRQRIAALASSPTEQMREDG